MRRTTESLGAWALALALGACGSPDEPSGDGGARPDGGSAPDAALADGGATLDAGMLDGAEPDSGPSDAGPPDRDSDGVPDDEDCAPDDTGIGREASRSCSTLCGEGTEECTSAAWTSCSAPTDCLCDAPGARRVVACGRCGEQAEECMDGTWAPASSCLAEGVCEPGSVERLDRYSCRVDERLCRSDCTWNAWTTVVPAGVCEPGSRNCDGTSGLDRVCTEDCHWVDDPTCHVRDP